MPAGRRPTPTPLKLLKGNPGKRPLPSNEPAPPRGIPSAPRWLSAAARKHWKEIATHLDEMGVLSHADGTALALLVDTLAEWIGARKVIEAEGATYTTVNEAGSEMHRARPEVGIASDAWKRVKAMLIEFGLTPAARAKVERIPATAAENDPWSALGS